MNFKTLLVCSILLCGSLAQEESSFDDEPIDASFHRAEYVEVPPPPAAADETPSLNDIIELDIKYVDPPKTHEVICWWEDRYRVCYRVNI